MKYYKIDNNIIFQLDNNGDILKKWKKNTFTNEYIQIYQAGIFTTKFRDIKCWNFKELTEKEAFIELL